MFAVGSALVAIHSLPVASAVGAKIFVVGRKLYSHILVFIRCVCNFQMSGRIIRRICKISVVFSRRIQIIIARDAFECVSAVGKGLVLRAKIDMASSNINMRDPIIYRIMKVAHHRTGDKW